MPYRNKKKFRACQTGQSLIEITVVLLLISICTSGMMLTLLKSQQLSRLAIQHSDAVMLATSLINKMHRNKQALHYKESSYFTQLSAQSIIKVQCTQLDDCASQRQALADIADWQVQLEDKLPGFYVEVCRDDTPELQKQLIDSSCDNKLSSNVAIKIWWKVAGVRKVENAFYTASAKIY